jgi:anti-sigma B factor antagonist
MPSAASGGPLCRGHVPGSSCADGQVGVALGARRPGCARNQDGRPTIAPQEINLVFPGSALSVRGQDGYTIVTISGELHIASVPVLREQILGLPRPQAGRIVIDLSGVTFCDSSALAGASRHAGQLDGVLHMAAPTPLVATLLCLTGLDSRFQIFAAVPDAISAPVHGGAGEADAPKRRAC